LYEPRYRTVRTTGITALPRLGTWDTCHSAALPFPGPVLVVTLTFLEER